MRKRHSEEQIVSILKEAEDGVSTVELCRKHGVSDATFYKWRQKYGGMEASDVKELRALREENQKLKRALGEAAFDKMLLKDALTKKW